MTSTIHQFADVDADTPEFCSCGAGFWEGFNLQVMKRAHIAAHAEVFLRAMDDDTFDAYIDEVSPDPEHPYYRAVLVEAIRRDEAEAVPA